jgi:hypothetical protein
VQEAEEEEYAIFELEIIREVEYKSPAALNIYEANGAQNQGQAT